MKPTRLIQKSFAIILLLVFAQKVGVELYLHNWLHANKCKQEQPNQQDKTIVTYSCHCFDDFTMPFTGEPEKVSQPISSVAFEFTSLQKISVPFSSTFFFSLRAPPFNS